jgi:hypothetical protein
MSLITNPDTPFLEVHMKRLEIDFEGRTVRSSKRERGSAAYHRCGTRDYHSLVKFANMFYLCSPTV